jgi:hypothetical protein
MIKFHEGPTRIYTRASLPNEKEINNIQIHNEIQAVEI